MRTRVPELEKRFDNQVSKIVKKLNLVKSKKELIYSSQCFCKLETFTLQSIFLETISHLTNIIKCGEYNPCITKKKKKKKKEYIGHSPSINITQES